MGKENRTIEILTRNDCVYACMGFLGVYICYGVVQDIPGFAACQCQRVGCMSSSRLLDLRAKESRFLRHVKPPRCVEASRNPQALN